MELDTGVEHGHYPDQPVYHCPFGGCVQWLVEFPVETYTAPACPACGHELVSGATGEAECGECGD
jgi:hypothetical protein